MNSAKISLTKGQWALVDEADFVWLNQWKWYASWCSKTQSYYARRSVRVNGKKLCISMHRLILGLIPGDKKEGDHANHDTLDNRRSNLRVATSAQNSQNMDKSRPNESGYRGVFWHAPSKLYIARIWVNGKPKHLGYFRDPAKAHEVYRDAAKEHFGEFATFYSSREERRQVCSEAN